MGSVTPEDLRAEIERTRAEILRLTAYLEALARALEMSSLPSNAAYATIDPMTSSNATAARKPGRISKSKGPVMAAVRRLKLVDMADLAARIGENAATVRTWDKRGSIPEYGREKIAQLTARLRGA